jgi:hypothetical protein
MKIYQLKTQVDPDRVITIATFSDEHDSHDALADWSETEKLIQLKLDSILDSDMDKHYNAIIEKIPEWYNSYGGMAWVEEVEVLDNYNPESLEFDFSLLDI